MGTLLDPVTVSDEINVYFSEVISVNTVLSDHDATKFLLIFLLFKDILFKRCMDL